MQDTELDSSWLESGQRTYYGRIPNWIVRNPNIGDAAKVLYAYLDSRLSRGVSETFPSNKTIAADLGKSVPTINRLKAELAMAGAITTRARHRGDGSQTSSVVVLSFTSDAFKSDMGCIKSDMGGHIENDIPMNQHQIESYVSSGEDTNNKPRARTSSGRRPPTEADAFAHAKEIGLPQRECELFLAHHDARDWTLKGGMAVKCWKSCMKTWKGNYDKRVFEGPSNTSQNGSVPSASSSGRWTKEELEARRREMGR